MKKKFTPFAAGMLTMALVGGLAVSALAASGAMTITVDPINIQVNGQTFAPKDATGADVPVFAYNGTTYAPLRALAEAYGLEVGYDTGTNMATVTGDIMAPEGTTSPAPDTTASAVDYSDWTDEEEAAYQEFKGLWRVEPVSDDKEYVSLQCYKASTSDNDGIDALINGEEAVDVFLRENSDELIVKCCLRLDSELYATYQEEKVYYHFTLWGAWGWPDTFNSGKWTSGYKDFLDYSSTG